MSELGEFSGAHRDLMDGRRDLPRVGAVVEGTALSLPYVVVDAAGRASLHQALSDRRGRLLRRGFEDGEGGAMPEDEDGLWDEVSYLWVEFPITGHWGTVEELWSRHELEDLLDQLLRRHQLGRLAGGGQGFG